jgi:CMP-N-acetylneuraminic acid synthetase
MSASVVAFITARGGSKGLPRKNLLPLAGKPLIAYTIIAAQQTKVFDEVYVTTDDAEIAAVSRQYGAQIIDRPSELAADAARSEDVITHALSTLDATGQTYDYFVLLQPTSPLRTAQHITECWEQYRNSKARSTVAVTEVEHHPYKDYAVKDGFLQPLFSAHALHQSRHEYPHVVRQNGAIYIMSVADFLDRKTFCIEPVLPYFMSREDSIDIDSIQDLQLAEYSLV